MKVNIEVDIPAGYEFVRFGKADRGDNYLVGVEVREWTATKSALDYIIVKEKKSDEQLVRECFDALREDLKSLGYNNVYYRADLQGQYNTASVAFSK